MREFVGDTLDVYLCGHRRGLLWVKNRNKTNPAKGWWSHGGVPGSGLFLGTGDGIGVVGCAH